MTAQQQSALEEARAEAVQQGILKAERERSMVRYLALCLKSYRQCHGRLCLA